MMNVRTLIQTLLYCDPDSPVVLIADGKPVPLDRVVQGGSSLTAYLCDSDVGANEAVLQDQEGKLAPRPSLGQLIKKQNVAQRQQPIEMPAFYIHKDL